MSPYKCSSTEHNSCVLEGIRCPGCRDALVNRYNRMLEFIKDIANSNYKEIGIVASNLAYELLKIIGEPNENT